MYILISCVCLTVPTTLFFRFYEGGRGKHIIFVGDFIRLRIVVGNDEPADLKRQHIEAETQK